MPDFSYTGVDKSGQKVTGKLEAASEGDLRMILRGRGIRPTKIDRGANMLVGARSKGGETAPLEVLVMFTRQLQLLISSGVPLMQGLGILHEQSTHRTFKGVLETIKDKVAQGSFFWESLVPYPRIFPKLFVALVRAGEASGSLDQMLKRLSKYLEDAERLRRMLKGAMIYPIVVISIGILVIGIMMVFVIPRFEQMLTSGGQQLPEVTQFVIDLSHFMIRNIIQIVAGIGIGGYLLLRFFQSPEGRATLDRTMFNAPFVGPLMQKAGIARFSRSLQILLMSGVNVIDAIDICRATVDNAVIEEAVSKIRAEVEAGKTVGMVINKMTVFPKMAVQMIMVGESTGNLDKMLEKVADFYDQEVEVMVAGISKLIEPLTIVVLGGAVGFLMIAMYMPIFKLAGGAQ